MPEVENVPLSCPAALQHLPGVLLDDGPWSQQDRRVEVPLQGLAWLDSAHRLWGSTQLR